MPLGTEVGLGSGDVVLDVDPAPSQKRGTHQFSAHICCSNGRPYQLLLSSCCHLILPAAAYVHILTDLCFTAFSYFTGKCKLCIRFTTITNLYSLV